MTNKPEFWVKYWGVRGSIPSPGPHTAKYGGNTTCLQLQIGSTSIVIDGGTGVRTLGDQLQQQMPIKLTFLMTHLHWDHVQGFPFFSPFLLSGNEFKIISANHKGGNIYDVLKQLMAQPAFPISMEAFRAKMDFSFITPGDPLQIGEVSVKTTLLNHPGNVVGYRFEYGGKVFVHASDWEHPSDGSLDDSFVEFIRDADILSVDATYTDEEYLGADGGPPRQGWGHATIEQCIRHGREAGVAQIILTHHEPSRSDDELDALSQSLLGDEDGISFSHEGLVLTLI